jgi:tetratricopeptide (TPR) repeat protein
MILSCLSKAWAMTLPAVLIILDVYPLRRLGRFPHDWFSRPALRVWLDKIPFLVLAALTALQAARAQAGQFETMKTFAEHGLLPRLGQAFYGLGFYLHKTLLPLALGPIYEVPYQFTGLETANLLAAAVVAAITVILLTHRRRFPAGLAAWAFYVVVVSPVLGIAQSGPQLVKDSYSYLCCLPWGLLAAAALLYLWCPARRVGQAQPNPPSEDATGRPGAIGPDVHRGLPVSGGGSTVPGHAPANPLAAPLSILAACLVLALTATTFRQTRFWHDSISLWTRAVAVQPRSQNANNNLAILLRKQGRIEDAVACYRRAIESHPGEANAYYNLGNALKELARAAEKSGHPATARDYYQQAVAQYRLAIDREPLQASYHFNLANTLTNNLDRGPEALLTFEEALRILDLPKIPATNLKRSTLHYCIAFELHKLSRLDEARKHLDAALRLDPDLAPAIRLRARLDPTTP